MIKILGVDPGLNKTGWGVILVEGSNLSFIGCGAIHTKPDHAISQKLQTLHDGLKKVIEEYQPHEVAIEETFVNNNPLSSLKLGHARGALMLTISTAGFQPFEYSATAIKKAVTGVGRADKHQIGVMIKCLLPKAVVKTEDAADALAAAICHSNHRTLYNR